MSSSANPKRKRDDAAPPANHQQLLSKSVGERNAFVAKPSQPVSSSIEPPLKKPIFNSAVPATAASSMTTIKKSTSTMYPKPNSKALPTLQPREGATFIDEIINESNDLIQAAREAQSLGRLRAASSHLLLAHARLVGLGRRFDRSRCLEDEVVGPQKTDTTEVNENDDSNVSTQQPPTAAAVAKSIILPPLPVTHNALPDVTLMEHLARSGMELHHKRTGRGMQHDAQMEKMANTPVKGKGAASTVKAKEEDTPTKRKGGRGKKPPTLVMHTLLGAELDGKKLMRINPKV